MPCYKCRPIFLAFKENWSFKSFKRFRVKYTEVLLVNEILREHITELEEENKCIDTLRGQLQNAVNHLERAKRHWPSGGYDEAIAAGNSTLYETLNR